MVLKRLHIIRYGGRTTEKAVSIYILIIEDWSYYNPMKYFLFTVISLLLLGCASYQLHNTEGASNEQLCMNLGHTWLYNKTELHSATLAEVNKRDIDKEYCDKFANKKIAELSPRWKINLCQQVSKMHYVGAYEKYKKTMAEIERLGYADAECDEIAEFYWRKVARKQERNARISAAIQQASENYQRQLDRNNALGTYWNPINVNVRHY